MNSKRLRLNCEKIIEKIDFPEPFDILKLCNNLASKRGIPIKLLPYDLPKDGPCGLWISLKNADYIIYQKQTTRMHQEHIIAHEIGHIICEHSTTTTFSEETTGLMFPNLSPEVVNNILGRTDYTSAEEIEAETIASIILSKAQKVSRLPKEDYSPLSTIQRIAKSLEH